jgi:hypothetical protein
MFLYFSPKEFRGDEIKLIEKEIEEENPVGNTLGH